MSSRLTVLKPVPKTWEVYIRNLNLLIDLRLTKIKYFQSEIEEFVGLPDNADFLQIIFKIADSNTAIKTTKLSIFICHDKREAGYNNQNVLEIIIASVTDESLKLQYFSSSCF